MNELHITNWYPNPFQPLEAQFIREHFRALPEEGRRELWHLQVRSEGARFRHHRGSNGANEHYWLLDTPIQSWKIIEWLHWRMLRKLRSELGSRWWDVVVVHIAYPLLRFSEHFKKLFGDELVIVEHWSAFHTGFNLREGSPARARIQGIFQQQSPVVAVSEALLKDIRAFSGRAQFPGHVVGNVVNTQLFQLPESPPANPSPVFVMVGNWAPIKRPFLIFEAFRELLEAEPNATLRVIGYGSQWEEMTRWVAKHGLGDIVILLGGMEKPRIAEELRNADALLHASEYETFSVVCAEAACCGTPVVASSVGAIPEVVGDGDGLLVENDQAAWNDALAWFSSTRKDFVPADISARAQARFAPEVVGAELNQVLARYARAS